MSTSLFPSRQPKVVEAVAMAALRRSKKKKLSHRLIHSIIGRSRILHVNLRRRRNPISLHGDGDEEEEDTEPLADDFLDGSDDEEEPLGSDSDSDGFDLAMAGSCKSKAIDEERVLSLCSNFKDLRPEGVKKKEFVE
ncbi:unnamed protein product [Brassica oleracea]